ncbi:hypothetical protein [Teichococcus wenyumeiae]|uniref:hypothetical protein n=1 Tax=Teichococcus wenyumeiae TaxID=2478470 RepID=UPI0011C49F1B|nr:hypothetical protein [Pseudoroseomonas wenyumeiae]
MTIPWNTMLARAEVLAEAVAGMNAGTTAMLGKQDLRTRLEDLRMTVLADSASASVNSFLRSEAAK